MRGPEGKSSGSRIFLPSRSLASTQGNLDYGRWSVETSISNIDHTEATGPHRWYTAVGLRLSGADDGITFGTNHKAGLAITFARKVPSVIGARQHSALWVSVAEPEQLAAFIGR